MAESSPIPVSFLRAGLLCRCPYCGKGISPPPTRCEHCHRNVTVVLRGNESAQIHRQAKTISDELNPYEDVHPEKEETVQLPRSQGCKAQIQPRPVRSDRQRQPVNCEHDTGPGPQPQNRLALIHVVSPPTVGNWT